MTHETFCFVIVTIYSEQYYYFNVDLSAKEFEWKAIFSFGPRFEQHLRDLFVVSIDARCEGYLFCALVRKTVIKFVPATLNNVDVVYVHVKLDTD